MTEPSAFMPPLDCGKLGKLSRPTLLVTGERSPAMFLLVTAELERCLEGESSGDGARRRTWDAWAQSHLLQPGCNGLPAATLALTNVWALRRVLQDWQG